MSKGEDEPSPGLNGRLRPRKSTTTTPSPQNKTIRKTESKLAQDRPKRTSTPSKASPSKQDDLATKSDTWSAPLFLCPYCDRKFNARQTASKHARRIHLSTSKQDNFIKCLYCNHSDAESNAIIKHMVDSHPNQYFACLDCHTRFPSTTELAEHKFNVCEKQKPSYRSKLRQKTSAGTKKNPKRANSDDKSDSPNENAEYTDDRGFNGVVISCELKPSEVHDAADIEDKITTNLILPHSKSLGNVGLEKNAVIVLDDLHWNKRIPPNFSFHNTDADQILSRLGVVHRSPRVGESRKDLIRMMDEPNEKFEKCFDTNFYSKVAKNVQDNLAKCLDGSFNFNPDKDNTIKTRKSKASVVINTAEGFPILLAYEQFSRNLFDGFIPRAWAPKHKWKWDTAENDKNVVMFLEQTKRDSHVNNCIVTLISSLDIWTQLRMKRKFEDIFKTTPTAKKTEKQNIISMELKEILESRDIPTTSSQVVQYRDKPAAMREGSELPAYLGLSPTTSKCEVQPAVLSGEWVRPRCYVCCACGEQNSDARALSTHISSQHPNAQVHHYEIVGETLLSADILKHLYVPPSQISNRTRPPRGVRDCTKCKKSITLEDLHQHMLDCAGDTPTVRRKCRYRPFGVRRRRPRLPDNTIRKKMRKDMRSRQRQKGHLRPRPRIRTEVGDAETIRKMIADLPAKRNRITPSNVLRPRRNILKAKKPVKLRASEGTKSNKARTTKNLNKAKKTEITKKQNDTDSSTVDEDDQPLKLSATRISTRNTKGKEATTSRATINKMKKVKKRYKKEKQINMQEMNNYSIPPAQLHPRLSHPSMLNSNMLTHNVRTPQPLRPNISRPNMYEAYHPYNFPTYMFIEQARQNQMVMDQARHYQLAIEQAHNNLPIQLAHDNRLTMEQEHYRMVREHAHYNEIVKEEAHHNVLAMHQKIDVHGAGPSNIRQHSNRDDYNTQDGKGQPIGRGEDGKQNNNMAPAPNVPLKHSIASLTSDTEPHDASVSYKHPNLLSPKINVMSMDEVSNNRQEFEKEVTAEKLQKPPLPNDSIRSQEPSGQVPVHDSIVSQEFESQPLLPNDPIGSQEPEKQPPLLNDPIESLQFGGQPSLSNNSTGPDEHGRKLPLTNVSKESGEEHKDIEIKTDIEKSRLNKTRKGLNDCIAMLRTKKGLRLDRATVECGDDEILVSETVNNEIVSTDIIKQDRYDTTIVDVATIKNTTYLTPGQLGENNVNLTPAQVFSRSALSEQYQSVTHFENKNQPIDELTLSIQTDNAYLHQREQSVDNEYISPTSKQNEGNRNSTSTGSSSRPENKIASQTTDYQQKEHSPRVGEPLQACDIKIDNVLTKIPRNTSDDEKPAVKDVFLQNRMNNTYEMLIAINALNFTKPMTESQAKLVGCTEGDVDMQQLYSQRVTSEMYNQQSKANVTHESIAEIPYNTFDNTKLVTRQETTSPTSRRTRRKPAKKNSILEQQPAFDYKRSTPRKKTVDTHTAVSPRQRESNRMVDTSHEDLNMHIASASYLPATSVSKGTLLLKTPPASQVRRESYKRVLDSSESSVSFVHNRDITQSKILKKSPVMFNENTVNLPNLRRHSIELANAQCKIGNYDNAVQAYREDCENNLNISPSTRGHSHLRKTTPEDYIKRSDQSTHYDALNELQSGSAFSTFVSKSQDTQGVMLVNPTEECNNLVNTTIMTREIHDDRRKLLLENEQYGKTMHLISAENFRCEKNKSKSDYSIKDDEREVKNKVSIQEYKTNLPMPKGIDNSSHRLETRRCSGEYYKRSSPYQSYVPNMNVPNLPERSQDIAYDENRDTHDSSLRAYHKSQLAAFEVRAVSYSDNIYSTIPPMIPSLLREPSAEEVVPLDLSCDPKFRKEQSLESYNKSSDVSKNSSKIPTTEELYDESSVIVNFHRDYAEQPRNLPPYPPLPFYKNVENESNEELIHVPATDFSQEKTERNSINHGTKPSKNQFDHGSSVCESIGEIIKGDIYPHSKNSFLTSNSGVQIQEMSMINQPDRISNQRNLPQPVPTTATTRDASSKTELSANLICNSSQKNLSYIQETTSKIKDTVNARNCSTKQSLSQPPECNYFTGKLQTSKVPGVFNRQEDMGEKTFLENKKITRSSTQVTHFVPQAKVEDKTCSKSSTLLTTNINPFTSLTDVDSTNGGKLGNVNPHANYIEKGHELSSTNIPTKNENENSCQKNQILEAKVGISATQMSHQDIAFKEDNILIDQDPETARKIAMLPKELVEILGTMPKDHRNQLLNVLPQYVSAPVSTVANEMTNNSPSIVIDKHSVNIVDNKQYTAACEDSSRLFVNTAISASSIVPKKRHSPSTSTVRLNSIEKSSNLQVLRQSFMTTMSEISPVGHDDITINKSKGLQYDIDNKESASSFLTGEVTQKSLDKDSDDSEINVVDVSDPENMNKNQDIRSVGTAFLLPTQDVTLKPPTKPKVSNEQTASLRAVRIKTTSGRKSFSDEKKLPHNYIFHTNISADEKYTHPGQIINPEHYNYRNLTDFEYDKTITSSQLKIATTDDNLQDDNNTLKSSTYITSVNNKDTPHNHILHNARSDNQCNQTNLLEPSTSVAVQDINMEQDHFLGRMKSTTFAGGGTHCNIMSIQNVKEVSFNNETKVELLNKSSSQSSIIDNSINHLTTELESIVKHDITENTENIVTTDECIFSESSKKFEVEEKETLPPDFSNNKESQDESLQSSFMSLSERIIESTKPPLLTEISSKDEKSNDDDSEDDVALAVLKQKHCAQSAGIDTKQKTQKKHQSKVTQKRRKKYETVSESIQINELTTEFMNINNVIEPSDVDFSKKEIKTDGNKNTAKTLPVNTTVVVNDKVHKENYEFDVNKGNDVTENISKIKEDDQNTLPKYNQTETQHDNSIEKNMITDEIKDAAGNVNTAIDNNLQSEKIKISSDEQLKDLTTLESPYDFNENNDSVKESSSVSKKTKNSPKLIKCLDDKNVSGISKIDRRNTSDVDNSNDIKSKVIETPAINEPHSRLDDLELNKLPVVSITETKASFAASGNSIVSDFQLCSEIHETDNLPLRRSRRGKSMYVDSSCLEDVINNKTPLTMKRLILSRVEKDEKRTSEHITIEKDSDTNDDCRLHLTDSDVTDLPRAIKGKTIKRKKSPHTRRKSKKTKPISLQQHDEDTSDVSNVHSASENKTSILRELPNAENKIEGKETRKEDVKCNAISDTATCLSENSTLADTEKNCEEASESLIDVKESNVTGKRKLNLQKFSDSVSSKTKKTKYHKRKTQSDFDSDDEKGLLETKQQIENEKLLIADKDSTVNKPMKTLLIEDDDDKQSKSCDGANDDIPKQTNNASISGEGRLTCYNRPISNRRSRSSSTSLKDNANYDPYNIDFEDMLETTEPILKKRGKNGSNNQGKVNHNNVSGKSEDFNSPSLKISKQAASKIVPNVSIESDSDSSKSDVPLQKYVDEKALESELKNKNNIYTTNNMEKVEDKTLIQTSETIDEILDNSMNSADNKDEKTVEISRSTSKNKKSTKRVNKDDSFCEDETVKRDQDFNVNSIDQTSQKQQNKERKPRRTLASCNSVESTCVTTIEVDQQLRSDKFMENFGFYSERIPRKSNLLASKKISETFHMISNESNDSYFGYKEKSSKKSNQNENKKKSELASDCTASQGSLNTHLINLSFNVNPVKKVLSHCDVCKIDFYVPDNFLRHQMDLHHVSQLSKMELKQKTFPVKQIPNCLIEFKRQMVKLICLIEELNNLKRKSKKNNLIPTLLQVARNAKKVVRKKYGIVKSQGLSKDEALFLDCCEVLKESHKSDVVIADSRTTTSDEPNFIVHSTVSRMNVVETLIGNKACDETRMDDGEMDAITAQKIFESEEIRNLENDLISGFKEAADARAALNNYENNQGTSTLEMIAQVVDPNISTLHEKIAQTVDPNFVILRDGVKKINENPESLKKTNKTKPNKQTSVKEKMYPDIEEIDMFEDKFDKIKRKRRSQAVAAKQIQNVVETNTSVKSRKQTEKKKNTKNTKKNYQSTQVPTKGALKGFDGIKISIPTQDLNMPANVSPPRQQKKRKKVTTKRRKETSDSDSSCSERDEKDKSVLEKDIYEFKDSEDTELLELRPSTVMDRFRSMHNKHKFRHKERDKVKSDIEKEKQKAKEKGRKMDVKEKEFVKEERQKLKEREKYLEVDNEKRRNKYCLKEDGSYLDKVIKKHLSCLEDNLIGKCGKDEEDTNIKSTIEITMEEDICAKNPKCPVEASGIVDDHNKEEADGAVASTSGFVPDRMDESDYESEMSSPEGEFIFYMADDVNCVCPSDNDSDESDLERGCGRPNCIYKIRNADKIAAIGNIFKNNAVRCEKTDTKELEQPRPDMDQLFDSLLETNPNNSNIPRNQNEAALEQTEQSLAPGISTALDHDGNVCTSISPVSHDHKIASKQEHLVTLNKDTNSLFEESYKTTNRFDLISTKNKTEKSTKTEIAADKRDDTPYEIMSDSDSIQIFTIDHKPKDNLGFSLVSEECTQVYLSDIIAGESENKKETNKKDATNNEGAITKTNTTQPVKYNSEDEFDLDKPESLNRQYMHFILPAEKVSSCAQTDSKSDHSDADSGSESAATKYLKGLAPSEAANLEIYTMVSAKSTQTVKSSRYGASKHDDDTSQSKSEDDVDTRVIPRSRIRLQKFDVREIAQKSKSSKSIQTERNKSCQYSKYDAQAERDEDSTINKRNDRTLKKPESPKGNANIGSTRVYNEDNKMSPPGDSFAAPATRPTAEKHSPRKSDEGISTSHDYSADAFDQAYFDDTGVARQRARRKCTVGKQNILAEHWSSESEFDGAPQRPNSADSVVAPVSRKKKSRKKDGHHNSGGRKGSRYASKNESRGARGRVVSGGRSDESDACPGPSRAPPGPKIRARPAHHYWSSDGEETPGPQPQHGWIVGDSHKKLVTMLAHAKGRKRNSGDKRHLLD